MATIEERLNSRLTKDGDCLVFTGSKNGAGYGKIWAGNNLVLAHRLAFEVEHGPIPAGMVVCHRCDNRACCNVEHLFLGSQGDNLADMRAKGRHSRGESHAEAIRSGWTEDLRARRAEQTRQMMRRKREAAAAEAGMPLDWKRCPDCEEWKPMSDYQKNAARPDGHKPIRRPCSTKQAAKLRQRRKIADPT